MVSEQQIAETLESLLRDSNPNSFTSFNDVVQQLESKLGFDLSSKVDFISNQIHLFYGSQRPPPPPQPQPQPQRQPPPQQPPTSASAIHHQQPPPKDHFAPFHNPNFQTSPSQLPTNYAGHCPDAALSAVPVPPVKPDPAAAHGTVPEVPKQSAPAGTKRKGGPGGLNKLCGVSPELETIVGQPALPRTEIVKQLWAYIRKNKLQDPSNKRKIICNDELRLVFETDCTDMFKMNKLLAKHIIPLEPSKQASQQSKKGKADVEPATKSSEAGPTVIISEALANFFGVGGREMLQTEVLRRIYDYIKVNHLEDPLNPIAIQCDAKLQELLGCESVPALGIPEMLARHHLFKIS